MEKPTDLHIAVIFFETFWKKHQVVIMAPHNVSLLIMLVYNISKHLVRPLVCVELRLEASGGSEAVFLWKPEVVEKRPQDVVTVTIIVLMNDLFVKKYRYTPLQVKKIKLLIGINSNRIPRCDKISEPFQLKL